MSLYLLFLTVKTAALYVVFIKRYIKNTILKRFAGGSKIGWILYDGMTYAFSLFVFFC
jgi:hypothetical protein